MVLNNDTLEDYVATAGGNEVALASGKNEKSTFEGAVVVPADHDPDTVPTEDDLKTLRRVPAALPWAALALCIIELTERASYYGSTGPFNNFINNPLPKGGNGAGAVAKGADGTNQSAGALGLGSVPASALTTMFTFLAYVIPILGGIVADTRWGRFKTACVGTAVGAIAHVLLVIPAIPKVITNPHGSLGAFIIALLILAFAAGFIKPCIAPLMCDQSPVKEPTIAHTKSGERVIVDPQVTVERYMLIFYWAINIGSMFAVATQYSERLVGFWLAFLLPGILYMLMPIVLAIIHPKLVKLPPQGSVVPDVYRLVKRCIAKGGALRLCTGRTNDEWWSQGKPSSMPVAEREGIDWDDKFVEEVRATFSACAVFALIPIFILADGGIGNQMNDMSVAMTLNGVPNDVIGNFNSLSIIVATPILTYGLYPFLDRIGYPLKPMWRMSIGFLLGAVGCIMAAIIQWRVYSTSPCGHYATACDNVSPVSLWWQIGPILFPAVGELFVNVTSYELAYTRSPPRMKGLVYALALFNSAIAAAISLACSAAIDDPNLIIPWIVLAVASVICAFLFPTYFKHLDTFQFSWSEEEKAVWNTQREGGKAAHVESGEVATVPALAANDEKY
ncbi:Peptide transporter PTR2 [Vanrija pseudolonga]|uniref:Peptide transporter PTR2 n=1 Tax=Vanrija pseudolonga TaxID=143232 RepID=A0AAF0Y813_9TREE|nr:Peptide transporter PTR2 [Vanrija pseudolonga]